MADQAPKTCLAPSLRPLVVIIAVLSPLAQSLAQVNASVATLQANPVFLTASTYGTGNLAPSVVIGDFNGDGNPDFAVPNGCSSRDSANRNCTAGEGGITSRLGNGDGSFGPSIASHATGIGTQSATAADFNHDGKIDLAVANGCRYAADCTTGGVGVLLGKGNGSFQQGQNPPSGGFDASAIATDDFNADGNADLVVSNNCVAPSGTTCTHGSVSVLLGRGDGTFRAPVPYDSGGINHASLAVTDLNGDSKLDVAIANATGLIRVLLGRGDGTFEVAENPSTVDGASSVAAGDLNRDGKMDLAVASSAGSVTVLIGKGDGSFQSNRTYFTAGGGATGIGIDDLNNDGVPDLLISVSADFFFDAKASVMFGNGNGTFRPSTSYSSGGVFATSVAFGDLNKDGRLDFLVANTCAGGTDCNNTADDGAVSVFVNKGQGTFKAARVYVNSDCEESAVANGDFNRDGNADLAVTESCIGVPSGQVTIWLGRTNGVFKPGLTFPLAGHYVSSIHVADFNGDGKLDLVAASNCTNTDTCGTGSAGLSVLLGNGDGTFQPAQRQSLGGFFAYSVAVGNFDGDDVPDLAVFQRTICGTTGGCLPSSVSILLGNGDGTFGVSHTYASGGGTGRFELGILPVNFLSVADFNGDAKDDLAIANPCLDIYGCSSGTLRVLLGQGDGTFKVSQYKLVLPPLAVGITFGDLNNDDKLDLAVVSLVKIPAEISAPGVVSVLIGNGKGSFQTGPTYESGGTRARSIAIGDFNGDGERDVLVANDGNTGLLIGNGDATLQPPQLYNAGGPGIAIGDFNRDGRPDVAFAGTVILLNIAPRTTR